jgi:superfamily II helicase
MPKKRCSKCGLQKNMNEFFADKQVKNGKSYYCKACSRETFQSWYAKKKEKENRTYLKQLNRFLAQLQTHLKTHRIVPKKQTKKEYQLWLKSEAGQQVLGRFASFEDEMQNETHWMEEA